MIGLSLSLCIQDIAEGRVSVDDVEKLIPGTRFPDQKTWDSKIKEYREDYWHKNPDLAEKVVRQLLAEGKIEQPRLTDNYRFPLTRWGKQVRWVKSEDEIEWNTERDGLPI